MKTTWKIDPVHSDIEFKVRHLMITNVSGYFRKFDLEVITEDEDFSKAQKLEFTADIDSIDTNNDQRDTHLKSADFFDAANHPQLRFSGKQFKQDRENFQISGDLTIRGTTKPITFEAEFGGIVTDPYGQTKAGFSVRGVVNRKDFGLNWDAMTEGGKIVVGDKIKLDCEIQVVKQ